MFKGLRWLKREVILAIPAMIYFAISFNVIHFTSALLLDAHHIPPAYSYLTTTIAALIAGKIIIIVSTFPFLNVFHGKPLIYNICWKFFIYGSFVFLFRIFDKFTGVLMDTHNVKLAWIKVEWMLQSPLFWSIQIWLFLLFFLFIFYNELVEATGRDKVRKMIFG
jgi:hypothetical protein